MPIHTPQRRPSHVQPLIHTNTPQQLVDRPENAGKYWEIQVPGEPKLRLLQGALIPGTLRSLGLDPNTEIKARQIGAEENVSRFTDPDLQQEQAAILEHYASRLSTVAGLSFLPADVEMQEAQTTAQ